MNALHSLSSKNSWYQLLITITIFLLTNLKALAQACPTSVTISSPTASTLGTTGTWTAPSAGGPYKVRITAKGAKGGSGNRGSGGSGATVIGEFILNNGQAIELIAGAAGADAIGRAQGGGGGGSGARLQAASTPLLIAGAGSGSGYYGVKGGSLVAGTGQGGAGNFCAGGGGLFSKGGDGFTNGFARAPGGGGAGFNGAGGVGGEFVSTDIGGNGGGGYGGGGGGQYSDITNSAGGGGYSGGEGGRSTNTFYTGDGGTSINYGTNQNNTADNNNAGGQVIVECLGTAVAFAPTITATQPANGATNGSVSIDLTGDFNNSTNTVEYAIVAGSGTPAFTTISSEPFSVTSGTGTVATTAGSSYTVRVRLIYNPAIYYDYAYTLTIQPTRLYVKANASGNNTGLNWADAFNDLQSALRYTSTQKLTEIWVAQGTYKPDGFFRMLNGVTIYGGFVGNETTLSDRPNVNPVSDNPSSSTLGGGTGSVIFNSDGIISSAVLDGFVITGGKASAGGAIFNLTTAAGQVCSPTIRNCAFVNNSADQGGAIYNSGFGNSSPALINCLFLNNSSPGQGGAIYNNGASGNSNPTLTNCSFVANSANGGGAIYNYGVGGNSNPVLTNCSFLNNSSTSDGGAIVNFGLAGKSSPVLTNCSFLSNSATTQGGALSNYGSGGVANPSLINCVLWNNGGAKSIAVQTATVTASYSLFDNTVTGYTDGGNNRTTTTSPFTSTASVALNTCSPAINAGDPATTSTTVGNSDLASNPRFFNNGRIDMGAVEYQGNPNTPIAFTSTLASGSAVCVGSAVSVPVSVSGTVTGYQWYKEDNALTGQTTSSLSLSAAQTTDQGSYSLVVSGACNSLTSIAFSLTINTPPTATITPTPSSTIASGGSLTLTAATANSYLWSNGSTNNPLVLTNLTSATTLSLSATTNGCSATAAIGITINTTGPDLSPIMLLPDANFPSTPGASKNFVVQVQEVGGLPTSAGNITINLSAPSGYTLAFDNTLTSTVVPGPDPKPVPVNNADWLLTSSPNGQQMSLTIRPGVFIAANSQSVVGFILVRTTANSGSVGNITINVQNDSASTYDKNASNNVYARILNGL